MRTALRFSITLAALLCACGGGGGGSGDTLLGEIAVQEAYLYASTEGTAQVCMADTDCLGAVDGGLQGVLAQLTAATGPGVQPSFLAGNAFDDIAIALTDGTPSLFALLTFGSLLAECAEYSQADITPFIAGVSPGEDFAGYSITRLALELDVAPIEVSGGNTAVTLVGRILIFGVLATP